MTRYLLEIRVTPRPGLLDPEGAAIHHALDSLGFDAVSGVRVGKDLYVDLTAESEEAAVAAGEAMCRKLLANPVTEDFSVQIADPAAEVAGA